ncbi:MAG: sigma-E factor negative regulatory protein [Betaproteobacteria bacterium]|nr:sigma-E factor negative regulatory protein [Betaproteobacteria bacterium]
MNEKISALMDGELEAREHERCCARLSADAEALDTWRTYHLICDALRDTSVLSAGFADRVWAKLADEPDVLAPRARRDARRPLRRALSIAASIAAVALVGWMAFVPPRGAEVAQAPAKAVPEAVAQVARVPLPSAAGDYLLAHQAYSPRGNLQGVAPYVRTVSEPLGGK